MNQTRPQAVGSDRLLTGLFTCCPGPSDGLGRGSLSTDLPAQRETLLPLNKTGILIFNNEKLTLEHTFLGIVKMFYKKKKR